MKLNELIKEEFITDHDEIKAWLDKMKIKNYTIRPDGIVDVDGPVSFDVGNITSLPIQFGKISDICYLDDGELTSLVGFPSEVGDFFLVNKTI